MWSRAKEIADVKIQLHSCGSIEAFIPDLVEAGLGMINPFQINVLDMEPSLLKSRHGKNICFGEEVLKNTRWSKKTRE